MAAINVILNNTSFVIKNLSEKSRLLSHTTNVFCLKHFFICRLIFSLLLNNNLIPTVIWKRNFWKIIKRKISVTLLNLSLWKIFQRKLVMQSLGLNSIRGPTYFRKVHFLSAENKIRRGLAVEQRRQLWVQLTSYWQSEPTDIGLEDFRALPRVEGLKTFVIGRWLLWRFFFCKSSCRK